MVFGTVIGFFPEPLKPCIVSSICLFSSLKPALVLCHAFYRIFRPRFDRKSSLLSPWLRSDSQRWRSTGRTGMISRFVIPFYLVSFSLQDRFQNDMLMWLMSEAKGVERSIEGFARRLLVSNLAGIHSTSLASRARLSPSPIVQSNHRMPIDAHANIVPSSCPSRGY